LTSIYPNPFAGQFNFTWVSEGEYSNPEVKVCDVTGREIFVRQLIRFQENMNWQLIRTTGSPACIY
jgi:hypothetical protein